MKRRACGFSIVELLLVAAIFSAFLIVSYGLLNTGLSSWKRTANSQDVDLEFSKAAAALKRDLRDTAVRHASTRTTPWLPPGGTRGNVLWFLSAVDPASGQFVRKKDGTPFWQRNIVYYLAIPSEHDALYGVRCGSGRYHCPHGMLVRRVFDTGQATSASSPEARIEKLMTPAQVGERLKRPRTAHRLEFGNPTAESEEVVAVGLVDFAATVAPTGFPNEVELRLSGFQLAEAGKVMRLGQEDMSLSPYTRSLLLSVVPGN